MIPLHSDTAGRVRVRTTVGVRVGRRRWDLYRQLERGAFLAGFDGVDRVRDIAGQADYANLWEIRDDELLDAIDRDAELRRRVA